MSWNEFVNGLSVYSSIIWDFSKPGFDYFFRSVLPALFDAGLYFLRNIAPVIINIFAQLLSGVLSAL